MRTFDSGAVRDDEHGKIDPEGALSPLALSAYCQYMLEHTTQRDGQVRASDNWQKGFPRASLMKSMMRHMFDVWILHRDGASDRDLEQSLCALMFNVQAYLHEVCLGRSND